MTLYTTEQLCRGAGALEQAMRSQTAVPGNDSRMTPQVAVGVLSAAMRGGLPVSRMEQLIEAEFAPSAPLLKCILGMYEGDDWDVHLWNPLPNGRYKLCTDLCRPHLTAWRYDSSAVPAHF